MTKIAHYLQEHLVGEVMTSTDARQFFATDGSVFSLQPTVVVYPRNENDIRKATRFTWQLAERGRVIPITARGSGTDQGGAALGQGIMLVFPAHLHRILELDTKSGEVTVEPGINYGKLQQALITHNRFLPPYPASLEFSTVGGAVANNAAGEKSLKYGDSRHYVKGLRVVLANGEVIETGRLTKRELSKKLGLSTFEGEIYRAVDTLLEENKDVIHGINFNITKNAAGYEIVDIKRKDGSFDLTPLIVGSQGTLGIISEITLTTEPYRPETVLLLATFENLENAQAAVNELRARPELPSVMEMVDSSLLKQVNAANPNQLKDIIQPPFPAMLMLIEFDNVTDRHQKKALKKAQKTLEKYATSHILETESDQQEKLWKVRHAAATLIGQAKGFVKAVPIIEDGIVPPDRLQELMIGINDIFTRNHLEMAVWGHAGDANLHVQPTLNLGQVGDRQKAFRLMDEYYKLVIDLGGSTTGEHGDGRLRAPYLEKLYGVEVYSLFQKIKQIFDPYGTLNPGVKINVTLDDIKPLLRQEFSLGQFYNHLPHS
ncbi:MAG TPA: FAD-linked oxidase C-terminal domain-containing protein [Candidatus Dormibacteraeota bacterium]|nr:FAD-linked oxidase C-terminal domain-containing protein [Candidatus Dormibacteraeota bacterium]